MLKYVNVVRKVRASKPEDMATKTCFGKVIKAPFHPLEKPTQPQEKAWGNYLCARQNLRQLSS